jgi:hypothetical protein
MVRTCADGVRDDTVAMAEDSVAANRNAKRFRPAANIDRDEVCSVGRCTRSQRGLQFRLGVSGVWGAGC